MRNSQPRAAGQPTGVVHRISWGRKCGRVVGAFLLTALTTLSAGCASASRTHAASGSSDASVIVVKAPGSGTAPERAVLNLGGDVGLRSGSWRSLRLDVSATLIHDTLPRV